MIDVESRLSKAKSSGEEDKPEPSALLRKLMDSARPSELLPFPRNDDDGKPLFEYRMRTLTQAEVDEAIANAEAHVRRTLKELHNVADDSVKFVRSEAWSEMYENAKLIELLFLACRQPDDVRRPLFLGPKDIRKLLTIDEAAAMFNAYMAVMAKYGPTFRMLSDEEVEAWIDRIAEGANAYPFSHLQPTELAQLTVSLACRLHSLKTDTGSSGSGSPDTTSDTGSQS